MNIVFKAEGIAFGQGMLDKDTGGFVVAMLILGHAPFLMGIVRTRKLLSNSPMAFTDIRFDLVNKLPPKARPYALLMRLDRPVGWWLLLLPSLWAITLAGGGIQNLTLWDWYLMVLFFVGSIIMRSAGCIINDLFDRDLDAKVERTRARPLAAGTVSPIQAGLLLFLLLFLGLIILVQTSVTTIWLGFLAMIFVVAYPYMKRITWWPQAFLGITFNFGVLMGWAAVTHGLEWQTFLMYAGAFFWTLGYDTIYAHQDRDDDQMVGIKSTALLFGDRSRKWVGIFYAVSWSLLALCAFFSEAGIIALGLLILPGVHMLLQVLLWNSDDRLSSFKAFRSNRECGLLFLLAFVCS